MVEKIQPLNHQNEQICQACGEDLRYLAGHKKKCPIKEQEDQEREQKQHLIFATAEIISIRVRQSLDSILRNSDLTYTSSETDILSNKNLADKMSGAIKEILSEKLKDFDDEERYKIISKVDWPLVAQKLAVDVIYKTELIKTKEDVVESEIIELGEEEKIKEEKIILSDDDKKEIKKVVSQIKSMVLNLPDDKKEILDSKKEILVRRGIENIKVRFPAIKESEVLFELSKAPLFAKEVFAKDVGKYKHFADQKKAKEYEMEIIDKILINSMNFRIEQDTYEIIKGRKEITAPKEDVAKIREIVKKIFEETLKGIDLFRTEEVFEKIKAKAEFPEAIKTIAKEELKKAMQKEFGNRKLIGGGVF